MIKHLHIVEIEHMYIYINMYIYIYTCKYTKDILKILNVNTLIIPEMVFTAPECGYS